MAALMQVNSWRQFLCDLGMVSDPMAFLAAHCSSLWQPGPRSAASLIGLFLLGVGGGLSHCGGMCGPLVLGQVTDRLAAIPAARLCEAHRIRTGLLLPYHAGRLLTYAALGAVAGTTGLAFVTSLAPLRCTLLLLAAAMLLASATGVPRRGGAGGTWPARWVRGLNRTHAGGSFLFGVAMGLLPCGLLYAALVGACALATPLRGAAGMLSFGLGTTPLLAAIGIVGPIRPLRRLLPWLMVFNAMVLIVAAIGGVLV
jgi:sulfite exporter TauE/SafE